MEKETQIRSSQETVASDDGTKGVRFEEISEDDIQLLRRRSEGQDHGNTNLIRELQHPCRVCRVREGQFQPDSCHCRYSYCRKCAMKLGTGGKCISCGKFYGSIRSSR
jgi:hypothetical protein